MAFATHRPTVMVKVYTKIMPVQGLRLITAVIVALAIAFPTIKNWVLFEKRKAAARKGGKGEAQPGSQEQDQQDAHEDCDESGKQSFVPGSADACVFEEIAFPTIKNWVLFEKRKAAARKGGK